MKGVGMRHKAWEWEAKYGNELHVRYVNEKQIGGKGYKIWE